MVSSLFQAAAFGCIQLEVCQPRSAQPTCTDAQSQSVRPTQPDMQVAPPPNRAQQQLVVHLRLVLVLTTARTIWPHSSSTLASFGPTFPSRPLRVGPLSPAQFSPMV